MNLYHPMLELLAQISAKNIKKATAENEAIFAPSMTSQGMAKGRLLLHLESYALANHGHGAWRDAIQELPIECREVFESPVISSAWYPVSVWNRLLDSYLMNSCANPGRAMVSLAQHIAEKDLSSLFKLALRVGSPEFLLARTDSLYHRYFDNGRWAVHEISPRSVHCDLSALSCDTEGGPGIWTCREGICEWLRRALELTKTRAKVEHTRCRFVGAPCCRYDISW